MVYDVYDSVKEIIAKRDSYGVIMTEGSEIAEIDVSVPKLFEMFDMAKAGQIDLSKYGISKSMLSSLALDRDGKQNISVANMGEYFECGLSCFEEDLLVASSLAKLARTKGEFCHAFAIAYFGACGHWMTVVLHQDKSGKKQWQFMDSYNNQTLYKDITVNKISTVLTKSPLELKTYLIEAYDNSSDLINRRFVNYFNAETNRPIEGKKIDLIGNGKDIKDIKEFYIADEKNRNEYIDYISNRFIFMENADWLKKDIGREELERVQRLHAITKFMFENGDVYPALKEKLGPICVRLEEVIALNRVADTITNSRVIPTQAHQSVKKREVLQSLTAIAAVENGQPKQKVGLFKRLIGRMGFVKNAPREYNDVPDGSIIKPSIRSK